MNDVAVQLPNAQRPTPNAQRPTPELLSSSGRIQEVDALRGFAIFLVILAHSIIFFPVNLHEVFWCNALFTWIDSVYMPLFFVIAGFCYSCRDYSAYIRKKFMRLVVPYVVFSLIDMLPRQLLASLVNRPRPFAESITKALFYGGEFWFIYTLFVIFMIYPFIHRLIRNSRVLMIIACAVFLELRLHGVPVRIFMIGHAMRFLFFFHLGVTVKMFIGNEWPRSKISVFVMPLMLVIWLVLLWGVKGFRMTTTLTGIITCCLFAEYRVFNKVFARFGGYSLQIYLMNGMTLGISRAIICNVFHVYNSVAIVAFNVFVDLLVSYMLIKYVFSRVRLIRILMGM